MDVRETIFQLGYSLFTEGFKGLFKSKGLEQSNILEDKPVTVCRGCTIHTEVGQAYLYLLGISQRVDATGEIPKGIAGTIPLARAHIQKAYAESTSLMFIDPEIDDHAIKLATILPEIDHRLEFVANGREAIEITALCKEAWEVAYCIPEIIYRPMAPQSEVAELREQIEQLKQQVDAKLAETSSSVVSSDQ